MTEIITTKAEAQAAWAVLTRYLAPPAVVLPPVVLPPVVLPPGVPLAISYPFASHQTPYVAGIRPSLVPQESQDALIRTRYDAWKKTLVARCGGYVVLFNAGYPTGYATVSEGAGYGMLLTVLMAGYDSQARDLFNGLFKVVRSHPAFNVDSALMDWRVKEDCTSGGEGWNAMDGDLDIAMALLMADKQWGSGGAVNYKAEGIKTITAMKAHNFTPAGQTKGLPNATHSRTSDYMIGHFKAFRRATGDAFWDLATSKAFALLNNVQANYSQATGLIPDFLINADQAGMPSPGFVADNNANEGFYYWNACRLPWRLASDYVTSGGERSRVILVKMLDFFQKASGGKAKGLAPGYKLDGTRLIAAGVSGDYPAPAFIGPITAGAMVDARFQPFLNDLWAQSSSYAPNGYYDTELQILSLVVASGNWWNP